VNPPDWPDTLEAERFSALGSTPLVLIDLATQDAAPYARTQAVLVGVDWAGRCPTVDDDAYDCLLTTAQDAPRPWVGVGPGRLGGKLAAVQAAVAHAPVAAVALARVLRINEGLGLRDAMAVESFAYSTLLSGAAFRAWSRRHPAGPIAAPDAYVVVERDGDRMTITLDDPATRNAMSAGMRDALHAALAAAVDDPSAPEVTLRGAGRCFSVGGHLAEFGTAQDLAEAHAVRTMRACAVLLADLGARACVHLHGACIGSGIEIAAAAGRRLGAPGAWFQLPELSMGLIPGAGGTATLARAIGRHRTCWMGLSAARIPAATAYEWGLLHAIGLP
jgi:hypothetical protein